MNNLVLVLASNDEGSIESVLKSLPDSLLSDPRSELLVVDDDSQDRTFFVSEAVSRRLTRGARVVVLRNPESQGPGANQKLGFRYAVDRGFRRVLVLHGDGPLVPEWLDRILAEYARDPSPDAVFASREGEASPLRRFRGWVLSTVRNRMLGTSLGETEASVQSFSTAFLRRIPFERNSDDLLFSSEIVIQTVAAGGRLVQVPLPEVTDRGIPGAGRLPYVRRSLLALVHFRLQNMGFLYDPKFDVAGVSYGWKQSPHSSHSLLERRVPSWAAVLDIGCGEGWMARRLSAKGCRVDGVDQLTRESVGEGLGRYHQIDLNRNPDELDPVLRRSRYDVILMGDIIEHLIEPEALLDRIRSVLPAEHRPRLLVSTGNVAFLVVRVMLALGQFNYGPRGILDRTHRRLFTVGSFRRLFLQCGYRVSSLTAVPMPFTTVMPGSPRFARAMERLNGWAARLMPGLFAYQMIVEAEPSPTANQLLSLSETRAEASRAHYEENPISPS